MSGTHYNLILSAHQHCSHLSQGSKTWSFFLFVTVSNLAYDFILVVFLFFFKFYFCIWFYCTVYMCHRYCAVLMTILVLLLNKFDLIWFRPLTSFCDFRCYSFIAHVHIWLYFCWCISTSGLIFTITSCWQSDTANSSGAPAGLNFLDAHNEQWAAAVHKNRSYITE